MSISFDHTPRNAVGLLRNTPGINGRPNRYCSKTRLDTLRYRLTEDCHALRETAAAFATDKHKVAPGTMMKLAAALEKARDAIETACKRIGDDPAWLPDLPPR